jgi:hypothetical protein
MAQWEREEAARAREMAYGLGHEPKKAVGCTGTRSPDTEDTEVACRSEARRTDPVTQTKETTWGQQSRH